MGESEGINISSPDILFKGIPRSPTRGYTARVLGGVQPDLVVIPCTGSFSLAHVAREAGVPADRIVCGDISLYSTALGNAIMGTDWRLDLKPEQEYGELIKPYLTDPVSKAAAVLLMVRICQYTRVQQKLYHTHRQRELIRNVAMYIDQLRDQIEALAENMRGLTYKAQDMWVTMEEYCGRAGVVNLINPPRYCLAPNQRILTANLQWKCAGELREGDEILAFDEDTCESNRRRWRFGKITYSARTTAECVRVHLADGSSVVCSVDHPWLADRFEKGANGRSWVQAKDLTSAFRKSRQGSEAKHPSGYYVLRVLQPWYSIDSYDAGWLAGMFDGEGTINLRAESTAIALTQVDGLIQDAVTERLTRLGFDSRLYARNDVTNRKPIGSVEIRGGFAEHLRFLGSIRPERLLRNFQMNWHEERGIQPIEKQLVVAVEPIGVQEIQSISTSTRTYIGEGFMMHNTGGYDRMFKGIDQLFDWDEPQASQFVEKDYARLMDMLKEKPALSLMYYATDGPDPVEEQDWGDPWRSVFADRPSTIGHSAINWIIANRDPVGIEASRAKIHEGQARYPLFDGMVLPDSQLWAQRTDKITGDFYRDLFIHKLPGSVTEVYVALMLDGHLMSIVGLHLADLRRGKTVVKGDKILDHCASITFAFTCPHPAYDRLHKLTLASIASEWFWVDVLGKEAWFTLNGAPKHVKTTMLTNHPENKTARGILKLDTREPQKDGTYKLTYSGAVQPHDRQQTLTNWLSKFSDVRMKVS